MVLPIVACIATDDYTIQSQSFIQSYRINLIHVRFDESDRGSHDSTKAPFFSLKWKSEKNRY